MRKRTISKHFRFTPEEAADLKEKAQRSGMSEGALLLLLLQLCNPKEKPGRDFYIELASLTSVINDLAKKSEPITQDEIAELRKLRLEMQRRYTQPERLDIKWQ